MSKTIGFVGGAAVIEALGRCVLDVDDDIMRLTNTLLPQRELSPPSIQEQRSDSPRIHAQTREAARRRRQIDRQVEKASRK